MEIKRWTELTVTRTARINGETIPVSVRTDTCTLNSCSGCGKEFVLKGIEGGFFKIIHDDKCPECVEAIA